MTDLSSIPYSTSYVECPKIAAPYAADAQFILVPEEGWYRILNAQTGAESREVLVTCADPKTGAYQLEHRTHDSNFAHLIFAVEALVDARSGVDGLQLFPADTTVDHLRGETRERTLAVVLPDLPAQPVTVDGVKWSRERPEAHRVQWIQYLEPDQYDWDPSADDVSLVGTDTPMRVVSLSQRDGCWEVEALETAGPDYHRPGYTELISSDYAVTSEEASEAIETVEQFLEDLS